MPDNMTKKQRSALMAKIKGSNTGLERMVFRALRQRGLRFSRHVKTLPGRPDIVFRSKRIAVFIDGDFWHGWQYPRWRSKLSGVWRKKIEGNRTRDRRNFARLRRNGWTVIRLWEHEIEQDCELCMLRVLEAASPR